MTLKTKNAPYLVAFVVLIYVCFALVNNFDWSFAQSMEIGKEGVKLKNPLFSIAFYFFVLIATYLLPSEWKHRIIYMRWHHPLPGNRVFSELLKKDERISQKELIDKYGDLPCLPEEQNKLWYKIYKEKQNDEVVINSHGRWLLFRDMFSIVVLILFPSTIFTFWHSGVKGGSIYALFCFSLFVGLWISARNTGKRFACNVLAR